MNRSRFSDHGSPSRCRFADHGIAETVKSPDFCEARMSILSAKMIGIDPDQRCFRLRLAGRHSPPFSSSLIWPHERRINAKHCGGALATAFATPLRLLKTVAIDSSEWLLMFIYFKKTNIVFFQIFRDGGILGLDIHVFGYGEFTGKM